MTAPAFTVPAHVSVPYIFTGKQWAILITEIVRMQGIDFMRDGIL
jgi:hypothetical protein